MNMVMMIMRRGIIRRVVVEVMIIITMKDTVGRWWRRCWPWDLR